MKDLKKIEKYFAKNPMFNSLVHVVAGMGIGVLMTYPMVGVHPVRWGVALLALGLVGHIYPLLQGK